MSHEISSKENQSLCVKLTVSFLQWGERPGNLRFTLFTNSPQLPLGCVSIGGMAAYKMQKIIQTSGPIEARVMRGGAINQFVLVDLLGQDGYRPWKEVVFAACPAQKPATLQTAPVELSATRVAALVPANRLKELVKA